MANWKSDLMQLLLHGVIFLISLQVAVGQYAATPILVLAAVRIAIDALKTSLPSSLSTYFAEQAAHFVSILTTAILFPDLASTGIWSNAEWWPGIASVAAGAVLATLAGGQIVALLLARFSESDLPTGLADEGHIIGLLERGIIFALVIVGQPAVIGFLIALKAIMQFEPNPQKFAIRQYVIIGTLASFGWAIVAAYATLALLQALPPLGILPPLP